MSSKGKASSNNKASTRTSVEKQTEQVSPCTGGRTHDSTPTRTQCRTQRPVPTQTTRRPRAKSPVQDTTLPAQSAHQGGGTRRKSLNRRPSPSQIRNSVRSGSIEEDPSKVLLKTLDQLKIRRHARSKAAGIKNEVVAKIKSHLERSRNFNDIKTLPTGSYFENLKISSPDEFDVMFTVRVDRVDVQPFGSDGAYYSVRFKRLPKKHVLDQFLQDDDILCASKMLAEFRREVKEALKTLPMEGLKMEPKKPRSPAVTLVLKDGEREISIDIVLGLEVCGSWPLCAQEGMGIENWLGTKVKREYKFKPYYLVPKHEGSANKEEDGVRAKDVWRISFSHVEKEIMKNHGSEKTCCEEKGPKCCRKQCLKLLKHLLTELKVRHPSELSKFCSYFAKTTLLHACMVRCKDSEWMLANLHQCFDCLLEDFVGHLRRKELPNFFVPQHNLLGSVSAESCKTLAKYIETERNNGFPIFKNGVVKG
ncbi:hypothetical protein ACEWY4_021246 [Coilia grayii]|uniref:Cyclic GMP-AMP synthase n=1 Tax=Coilia grayii TaxID=363190 RepID=A0ABD1J8I5_9TELE